MRGVGRRVKGITKAMLGERTWCTSDGGRHKKNAARKLQHRRQASDDEQATTSGRRQAGDEQALTTKAVCFELFGLKGDWGGYSMYCMVKSEDSLQFAYLWVDMCTSWLRHVYLTGRYLANKVDYENMYTDVIVYTSAQ